MVRYNIAVPPSDGREHATISFVLFNFCKQADNIHCSECFSSLATQVFSSPPSIKRSITGNRQNTRWAIKTLERILQIAQAVWKTHSRFSTMNHQQATSVVDQQQTATKFCRNQVTTDVWAKCFGKITCWYEDEPCLVLRWDCSLSITHQTTDAFFFSWSAKSFNFFAYHYLDGFIAPWM